MSGLLPPDLRAALGVGVDIADLDLLVCEKDPLMRAKDRFFEQGLQAIPFVLCAVTAFSWIAIPVFSRRGTPDLKELPDPPCSQEAARRRLSYRSLSKTCCFQKPKGVQHSHNCSSCAGPEFDENTACCDKTKIAVSRPLQVS